ncbi:alpha/beta hydrolase-fold protein [Flavobacterium sp. H122]|uniref:carboxylesterase family protein n=1 Tax=Flavobacterium sp. H122 TaxID=2529860 RepID=UPI0010A9D64E|nr:alpha/beta hydrolase-fold protein [Flavobacterium sp. H122]
MTRLFLVALASITLLASCSANKKQSGEFTIENTADTTFSKQSVLKIKSLDNAVFDAATFTGNDKIEIKYRLFKPKKQKNNKKYPLVVLFHGSGAVGTDNKSQLGILAKLFAVPDIQEKYPAYILAPQFPTRSSDYQKDTKRNLLSSTSRPCLTTVFQLIDSLKSNLNIDHKRIYVIGFSMGGSTVINSLAAKPELFAAGISISGIPQFDKTQELKNTPIWLIHGIDDTENPINSDEQFYRESDKNVLFWKLKATAHDNIFTSQILEETLPKWLFAQRKK